MKHYLLLIKKNGIVIKKLHSNNLYDLHAKVMNLHTSMWDIIWKK